MRFQYFKRWWFYTFLARASFLFLFAHSVCFPWVMASKPRPQPWLICIWVPEVPVQPTTGTSNNAQSLPSAPCHDPGLMAAWQSQRTPPLFSSYNLGIILQTMSYISSPPLLVSSPCHYLHLSLDCCNSPHQPSCLQSALLQCILHVTEWSCGNTAMTLLLHLKCIGSSDKDKILPFSSKSSKILTFNSAKSDPQEIWNLGAVNLWETRNPAPEFRRGIAKWLLPHASMPFLV